MDILPLSTNLFPLVFYEWKFKRGNFIQSWTDTDTVDPLQAFNLAPLFQTGYNITLAVKYVEQLVHLVFAVSGAPVDLGPLVNYADGLGPGIVNFLRNCFLCNQNFTWFKLGICFVIHYQ